MIAEGAIKAAVKRSGVVKCQGKGGICPKPAICRSDSLPGVYCENCMNEIERIVSNMRDYVEKRGLMDKDRIIENLKSLGFIVRKGGEIL